MKDVFEGNKPYTPEYMVAHRFLLAFSSARVMLRSRILRVLYGLMKDVFEGNKPYTPEYMVAHRFLLAFSCVLQKVSGKGNGTRYIRHIFPF